MNKPALSETHSFDQPKIGSNRGFGFVFAAVFCVIGLWPLLGGHPVRLWAFAVAAIMLLAALFAADLLGPLNRVWFRFGMALGRVVTPLVMGLLFFVAVTPMALVLRALGKDSLRLKRDPTAETYWLPRTPPGPEPGSLKRQF